MSNTKTSAIEPLGGRGSMEIGNILPALDDLEDQHGRPLNWRDMRRNRVVLFAHPGTCLRCASYGRQLIALRNRFAEWDGDVWLVGDSVAYLAEHAPDDHVRVVGDTARRAHRRCRLPERHAATIIADRWGQVWQIAISGGDHAFPDPADLCATAQFIAVQCPECETPDQPAGDWSTVR
jgi:ribosomal protein S27E